MISNIKDNTKTPVIFVGHGSPMNAIEINDFTKSLNLLGKSLSPPKAILSISAHWLTDGTFVNNSLKPKIIYDFRGFPEELYRIKYPADGSPQTARDVANAIPLIHQTVDWGLDHGTWAVLKHIFPDANIPVCQLSIDYHKPMQYHFDLAKQLNFLRAKGVLILGSGNIVHNLRLSFRKMAIEDKSPYDWAVEFDEWVKEKIIKNDFQSLINYDKENKNSSLAVPTVDHYVPLIYCLALAGEEEPIEFIYEGVEYGGLSMRTFRIG